jgi:hypothetical protein
VAQYAATCRRRDLRLAAVFVGGLIFIAIGVSLRLSGFAPRGQVLGVDVLGLCVIAGVFAYVIATTRRFHRTHAPRCPSCNQSLPKLRPLLPVLNMLREFEEDLGATQNAREQLRDGLRESSFLRCSHCHALIAGFAV